MPNLQKIVKLTQQQYNILESGGTVGSYTGLNTNYIYLVQDNNQYATEDYVDGAIDDLSTVAKTGSYNDLLNKPTIPTVNNGTLFIQKNNSTVATFTANQSGNVIANISVPTSASQLSDYSNLIKNGDIILPGSGYSYVYNSQLDDAMWAFAKRYYIIVSIHPITVSGVTYPHTDSSKTIADDDYIVDSTPSVVYNTVDNLDQVASLFDGSTDTAPFATTSDNYIKVRMIPLTAKQDNYSPSASTSSFSGYPYGWFAVSTYWGMNATKIQYATYNKHSSWAIGWYIAEGSKVNNDQTWKVEDTGHYTRTVMDFWFIGDGDSSHNLRPTSIYWIKNRVTDINEENAYLSKYVDETLVNSLIWKEMGVQKAKIQANGVAQFSTIYEGGTTLSNKYLGKSAKAADSDKLDGNDSSYFQKALPTTSTAGKVLKSTSTAGTVEWGDAPATGVTDVKIGTTSIVSSGVATIPSASSTATGLVNTDAQTFAGIKTFSNSPVIEETGYAAPALKLKGTVSGYNGTTTLQAGSPGGNNITITLPSADGTLATTTYVSANPSTTSATLTGIKIGSTSYAISSFNPSDVPVNQMTISVLVDALTNLNGRVLSNYTATLNGSIYNITYGGVKCTEEQARNYMEYQTGSRYLPQYDFEKPKNSVFMFADRTLWKPQYDADGGLRLFRLSTALALDQDVVHKGTSSAASNEDIYGNKRWKSGNIVLGDSQYDEGHSQLTITKDSISKNAGTNTSQFYLGDNTLKLGYGAVSSIYAIELNVGGIVKRPNPSATYTYTFPTKTGTFALTSDITLGYEII